jgi:hypothetical protein
MTSGENAYHAALAQIAEIAAKAVAGSTMTEQTPTDDARTGKGVDLSSGCTVRALPKRLWQRAAQTATKINPVNAPLSAPFGAASEVLTPARLVILVSKYWGPSPRRLTVSFMESTPADLRARIVQHMNAWGRTTCISFAETSDSGQVRISREAGGYWSYLGTDILHVPTNEQTMNLEGFTMDTEESEFHRVVRHETGHTLGFPHEHMRKELVARINPEKAYSYFLATQGWDKQTVDEQVLTPLDQRSIFGTPPDQDSIMCYQLPGSITYDGQPIRGGTDINDVDHAFAGKVYPKVSSSTSGSEASRGEAMGAWDRSEDVLEPV